MSMNETQRARLAGIGQVAGSLQILLGIALFVFALFLYAALIPNVKEGLAASVKIANNIPAITRDIATRLEVAEPAIKAVESKMDRTSPNFMSIGDTIQVLETNVDQACTIVASLKSIPTVLDYGAWISVAMALVMIVNGLAMIIMLRARASAATALPATLISER